MELNALFPNFNTSVQFFSQEIGLSALNISERSTKGETSLTLLSIKTRCAFFKRRFEHTIVHNCSESSILLVRGSSSKYCGKETNIRRAGAANRNETCVAHLIKSADWSQENDGGSCRK